jgi:site-specific recombinase XerD
MLEDHLSSPVTRKRLRAGLAAPHIDDFSDWLQAHGFKRITIQLKLMALAAWTDWMRESGFSAMDLVSGLEACRVAFKQKEGPCRSPGKKSVEAASTYIRFLREQRIIEQPPAPRSPLDRWPILHEFRSWMRQHRGLREGTLDMYQLIVTDMVDALGDKTHTYTTKNIQDFVLNRAKPHGVSRAQSIVLSVRAFLRFLGATGQCSSGLSHLVPTFSSYRHQSVPRFIESDDMQKVIDACVAKDACGLRDRAVILLLSRLGLRAGDVAELRFEDIDWKNGKMALCGKNRRKEWMPLPQEVGDALLEYIEKGRPPIKTDRVFIRVDAPIGPLTRQAVFHITKSAIQRAGIKAPSNGPHMLRHSVATAMLREGVSLAGIGAVLRHQSPSTTAQYAKVDFARLSEIAQPWPVEVPSC